jgi:hypothetical protein
MGKTTRDRRADLSRNRDAAKAAHDALMAPFDPEKTYWMIYYTADDYTVRIYLFDPESIPDEQERQLMLHDLDRQATDLMSLEDPRETVLRGRWTYLPRDFSRAALKIGRVLVYTMDAGDPSYNTIVPQ